jgi:RNA-directed DNA polymerase
MNTGENPMDGWNTLPWKKVERVVFKLQKRIYRAEQGGEVRRVRMLQRLLRRSRSAKLLAVRRVTQDNQGKKTAGVDGVKSLTPEQRLILVANLKLDHKAKPARRVWIPKPGSDEQRPLGIPTIRDRALQTLVKMALEPQWEAQFEPNSYGFRPGRSSWDAIGAIYVNINLKPKWVLDADIAKCFDHINHEALLRKTDSSPATTRQIKAWLKSGVMDKGELFPTEAGTPQGGTLSPLLANIALHGLENRIGETFPRKRSSPRLIRYADDLVVLHEDRQVIEQCQVILSEELKGMGLELKPSKTRITHTLSNHDAIAGFDFLGFTIRQFPVSKKQSGINPGNKLPLGFKTIITPSKESVKKHSQQIGEVIDRHQMAGQAQLILALDPVIKGWTHYFSTVCSKETFQKLDGQLLNQLRAWILFRHSTKSRTWANAKYWKREEGKLSFSPKNSRLRLHFHNETCIKRHAKIQGNRSPYDGDWLYWSTRMGHHPGASTKVAKLLQRQKGKCPKCGLYYKDGDLLEIDHIIPKAEGGRDGYSNWQLLHRHCHDEKTAEDRRRCA